MIYRLALYLPFALASIEDLRFDAPLGEYNIPCVSGRLSAEPFSNRCFHLMLSSGEISLRGVQMQDYRRDIILAPVPSQSGRSFRMDRSQSILPDSWRHFTNYLGIGIGSDFGNIAGTMMLVPRNADQFGSGFEMIVAPLNPAEYCFDGQLAVANVIPGTMSSVEIEVSVIVSPTIPVRLADDRGASIQRNVYEIEFHDETRIPVFAWDIVIRALRLGGVRSIGLNRIAAGCEEMIPFMPTIQFSILNNGQRTLDIQMSGWDYISVDETTRVCTLHMIPVSGTNYHLGRSVIERVGLFFDYQNRQIGFCEPL